MRFLFFILTSLILKTNSFYNNRYFHKNSIIDKKDDLINTIYNFEYNNKNDNHLKYNSINIEKTIEYFTTIRDYTIITVGYKYKQLDYSMNNHDYDTYYVNLNNVFDKDEILNYLKNRYKNYDESKEEDNIWVFKYGKFIGFKDTIHELIKKNDKF
jgi:hypothetical protein